MNGNNGSDISPGMRVKVVRIEDQRSCALTEGVVRICSRNRPTTPTASRCAWRTGSLAGERDFGKRCITKHSTLTRKKPRTSQLFAM